jgi:DNA-binding HxlR family transcriptional regulator
VATYYRLTPKGEGLCPVFEELSSWAEEWQVEGDGPE